MINANPVKSLDGGRIIDAFETLWGDPLILKGEGTDAWRSFRFPPGTRIRLATQRIMSRTRVPDRKGSIKEMSGYDDFSVDIDLDLVLPAYSDLLPNPEGPGLAETADSVADYLGIQSIVDALIKLKNIWQIESRLVVDNERMNALGIEYLVLERFTIPDNPTYSHQPVQITAYSDTDYELLLTESKTGVTP
jgi:hypothetical protein